jgi:hypothetical protein
MPAENPSGTKILYIRWPEGLKGKAQIVACGIDGSDQRVVVDDSFGNVHVGAMIHWLDDEQFVHRGKDRDIVVRKLKDGSVVRRINCGSVGPVDYNPTTKLILAGNYKNGDVWTVNPFTGKKRKVLDLGAFKPWKAKMKGQVPNCIWHRYWNPRGTHIWIKVERPEYGFSFAADGSDIQFFPNAGSHPSWWSDKLIYCHGKLFERNRRKTGTVVARTERHLCHPGYSPDRKWVAGESSYGSNPVVLSVDYCGPSGKRKQFKLDRTRHANMVWKARIHVDASFSRDGNRIYVNWPVSATENGVFCYDITELRKKVEQADRTAGQVPSGGEQDRHAGKPKGKSGVQLNEK